MKSTQSALLSGRQSLTVVSVDKPIEPKRNLLQRRVLDVIHAQFQRVVAAIIAQFNQGITPDKVALTISLGVAIGLFPV
ncbi:MAG TPA: hypothetical protein VKC60_02570, partial [Opitutaceae bacterium]|nr:hypothetical protein [Opitutaceae bacterium]